MTTPEKGYLAQWRADPAGFATRLIETSERDLREQYERWKRWRSKYRGDWYLRLSPLFNQVALKYSTNYCFATVETVLAYLKQNPPRLKVVRVEASDDPAAQVLSVVLEDVKERAEWLPAVWQAEKHALICGRAWLKSRYDPSVGPGLPVIDALAPEEVLFDPAATRFSDCRWFIHRARFVDIDLVQAIFGKEVPQTPPPEPYRQTAYREQLRSEGTCTLDEVWYRVPVPAEEGGLASVRWEVAWVCNGKLLEGPIPNPNDHGEHPFIPLYDVEPDDGLEGIGELQAIEPLQDYADALDIQIYKIVKRLAKRNTFVGQGAGVTAEHLNRDDEPRAWDVTNPAFIKWDEPPALHTVLLALREAVERRLQKVSGVFEVTAGETPQRISAYSAIATLQSASLRRIYAKQSLNQALSKAGKHALRLLWQYAGTDRIIRVAAPNGQQVSIVGKYPPGVVTEDDKLAYRMANNIALVLEDVDFDFDVRVETDSALPPTRQERAAIAMDLYREKAIDQRAILDAYDWPEKEAIISRMDQAAQQQTLFNALRGGGLMPGGMTALGR